MYVNSFKDLNISISDTLTLLVADVNLNTIKTHKYFDSVFKNRLVINLFDTHLVSSLSKPIDGFISGEKNNISRTLHDNPRVGCTERLSVDYTFTDSPTVDYVSTKWGSREGRHCTENSSPVAGRGSIRQLTRCYSPDPPSPLPNVKEPLCDISRSSHSLHRDTFPKSNCDLSIIFLASDILIKNSQVFKKGPFVFVDSLTYVGTIVKKGWFYPNCIRRQFNSNSYPLIHLLSKHSGMLAA